MSRRALIVCPGRGSYNRSSLGILQDRRPEAARVIDACDTWRQRHGRPLLRHLDAEPKFRGSFHVAGENASLLTFAASLADLAELDRERFEIAGVVGNSLGWYTALVAAGALPLEDGINLVDSMGAFQAGNLAGGQIMTVMVDPNGRPDPELRAGIDAAIAAVRAQGAEAYWSIDLGSHAVLGASAEGLRELEAQLPTITRGERTFPIRLPLHSAFHTPLLHQTQQRAAEVLADLRFEAPRVPLIDGRGVIHRPSWADPVELAEYTLGHQIVAPFDFKTALITALQHTGAEVLVLLGPGNSLGGPIARMLTWEGWSGVRDRATLDERQRTEPLILSFGVRPQRARLLQGADD